VKRFSPADAAAPGLPGTRRLVRATLMTLATAVALAALALFAYALAAARVPQYRATLESLVRAETGLDVRFSALSLRWGWYGPEAVFQDVELRERGAATLLLRAPQLVAGVDLWRMLRSGSPAIGRITLIDPDIDLTDPLAAPSGRDAPPGAALAPGRLLAGWHGTRIEVEGGTLRAAPAGVPLAAGIRRLALRRSGSDWSAEGSLTLPQSLGTAVQAVARLHGATADPADLTGTITLSTGRLRFAGWHALLAAAPAAGWLPEAGRGDVTVQLELARGVLARTYGSLEAAGLAWPSVVAPAAGFTLERLHADWELRGGGAAWLLSVKPRAALELRLAGLALAATVGEASFDWSASRGRAERMHSSAQLRDLSISTPGGTHTLAGLSARLHGVGRRLTADLLAANARLSLKADPAFIGDALGVRAHLEAEDGAGAWRVSSSGLEIRAGDARLELRGALTGENGGGRPRLDAEATLTQASVEQLRALIGAPALAALGAAAGALRSGRIERAELVARGPLDQPLPWHAAGQEFRGSLELSGATLAGGADWPPLHGLDARIDWQAAHVRARIGRAAAAGLQLSAARGEWDERDATLTRLSGRLEGPAQQALAWLRDHPQLAANVPQLGELGISGGALLAFDVRRVPGAWAAAPRYTSRLTASLDGAALRPLAGVPGIDGLHGALSFADGHLQRSTVTGQWLGGPIALSVGERREQGALVLTLAGRGLLEVREAVAAAGGLGAEEGLLTGNAPWSAELRFLPAANDAPASWRVRADSNLVGVASALPEPFAKSAPAALPLRLELQGSGTAGQLKVALGERLHAVAAIARRGELWQIERGALSLAQPAPALPAAAEVRVEGSLERLDLASYAALWRALAGSPAWPALSVDLAAAQLLAGARSFPDVRVAAHTGAGDDELRLQSDELDALVRFPLTVDAAHPVTAHLERLDLAQLDPRGVGAAVAAALGPVLELSVGQLQWRGRSLGALTARVETGAATVTVRALQLSGAGDEARGSLECTAELCRANFSLESRAAAAMLARLGLRTDLDAAHAAVSGQLDWPAAGTPSLATTSGRIHLELEDGAMHRAGLPAGAPALPLALLAVPGLVAAMGLPELRFVRLSADFSVGEGQALTRNLHLDGDTEILMQGRVGLLARDYDEQVWVLKGEERLPAAVRGLAAGPRVAALWMSLRDFLAGGARERAAWRLRGTWDDPMVTQP